MVDVRVDHGWTHVDTKLADGKNSKTIPEQCERKDGHGKHHTLPSRWQEEVTCDYARDQQGETGVNAAAFRCNLEADVAEPKQEIVIKHRCSGEVEKCERSLR